MASQFELVVVSLLGLGVQRIYKGGAISPKRPVLAYNITSLTKTSTYIGGLVTSEQQHG
jgi:hypothetical protein